MTTMDESCLYGSEMMFDGMMSSSADPDRYDILSSALDVSTLDATSSTPAEVLLNSRTTRTTLTTTTMTTCTSSSTTTTTTRAAQHCIKISNVPSMEGPPRMVRLGSSDSSSSTSSSASCSSSSSASSSVESSPKRSIFKTYWEKTTDGASPPFRDLTGEEAAKACQDLIAALALQGADEVPAASSASPIAITTSSTTESSRRMESSAASPSAQQAPPSPPSSTTKRSIFGDRAMHTARVSSLPELPSIAATMLPVRKASSTEALVQVRRKSCLRSVQSYSSPSGTKNRKTAATTTTTMRMKKSASTTTPSPEGGGRANSSQVQFNPEVQVYEFQKSIYERMMLHVELSSRDWSKLFA